VVNRLCCREIPAVGSHSPKTGRSAQKKKKKERRRKKTCTLVYNFLLKCSHTDKYFSSYSRNAPINSGKCPYFVAQNLIRMSNIESFEDMFRCSRVLYVDRRTVIPRGRSKCVDFCNCLLRKHKNETQK